MNWAEWDEVLAVNLTGAFLCAKAVLPDMMARRVGRIINIASVISKIAYSLRSPYAVSKWGLSGLTRTLVQKTGVYNIPVNAVCPGPVSGERIQNTIQKRATGLARSVAEVEQMYTEATALKRVVEADEVAAMVAFLASNEANSITGATIDVTAGYSL
ncbi:MAG: SDR family oxidoreductase [Acidobacteriota bacterium]